MLKKILYAIALIFILGTLAYRLADEPRPEGEPGPRAEMLTDKMLKALNYDAWKGLNAIAWSYPLGHHYLWDKQSNLVRVAWNDYEVLLNPDDRSGIVFENGKKINNPEDEKDLLHKAFEYFANDSFWLIAPFKCRDPGTTRSLVKYEGEEALLVQYTSGGVTPGDAYLWLLDESGMPKAWKFWVQIVPVGGLKFTWEQWKNVQGAKISTYHDGLIDIEITNLKWANNAAALNNGEDPFERLR
ncbi:MAG: hypothetical protein R3345_07575 [Fulvivirga sp.]|nr:hypothetical protein [Fulvivirga sp.]